MFLINNVIENIEKYGKCKIYFKNDYDNQIQNRLLNITVGEDGNLVFSDDLQVFDKPFWNGCEVDETAKIKETIQFVKLTDLAQLTVLLLYCSFYDTQVLFSVKQKTTNVDTQKAVGDLKRTAIKMLEFSTKDCVQMLLGGEKSFTNLLISKNSIASENEELTDELNEMMQSRIEESFNRYSYVSNLWRIMNDAETKEQYEVACKKWDSLNNSMPIPDTGAVPPNNKTYIEEDNMNQEKSVENDTFLKGNIESPISTATEISIVESEEETPKILTPDSSSLERGKALYSTLSFDGQAFRDEIQLRREERYLEMIDELPPMESPTDRLHRR
ncbi:MAG: hypothetical protein RSD06_05030 [Bacilli bacterium]